MILSKLAVDADTGKIVHPKSQQLFEVDHANMKVVGEPQPMAGPMDPELEEARSALEAAMEQYVDAQYQEDTAASAVYAVNGELRVVVSGEVEPPQLLERSLRVDMDREARVARRGGRD